MGADREMLGGDVRVAARSDYVFVWHGRAAQTVPELEEVLRGIERALREAGVDRLLFDSRDSDHTPADVQARLWTWLEGSGLSRIGTLVRSENLAVSLRMTGVSRRVNLRAFDSEVDAARWLRG